MAIYNGTNANETFTDTANADTFNYGTVTFSGGTMTAARGLDTISGGGGGFDTLNFAFSIDHLYGERINDEFRLFIQPTTDWDDANPRMDFASVFVTDFFAAGGSGLIERINFSDAYVLSSLQGTIGRLEVRAPGGALLETDFFGSSANDSIAGTDGRDLVQANFGNDTLNGAAGDDTLDGGAGADRLRGGSGNDDIDGGTGIDTLDLSSANGRASADLSQFVAGDGTFFLGGNSTNIGNDTLDGIENVVGSAHGDALVGNGVENRLAGGAGIDTLSGGIGDDTLLGGADGDVLSGGAGNDLLDGGAITDPSGWFDPNSATYGTATAGVRIDLGTGEAFEGDGSTDTLVNIAFVTGSNFDDTLTGSSAARFEGFFGGSGNDRIDGGKILDTREFVDSNRASFSTNVSVVVDLKARTAVGQGSDVLININQVRGSLVADTLRGSDSTSVPETFEGMAGDDRIDGRGGIDIARYDYATVAVTASLASGSVTVAAGDVDTLVAIEGLRGSQFDDTLVGGNAANASLEFFRGNGGNDSIDGGDGYDRVDYVNAVQGVVVTLGGAAAGTATDGTLTLNGQLVVAGTAGATLGTDLLRNIEAVRGSDHADRLNGSGIASQETFEGRGGNDTLDGNGGSDRASWVNASSGVVATLGLAGADGTASDGYGGTDTLRDIENLQGSRDFADRLTGNQAANVLDGLGGADTLSGGGGNDTLTGGAGHDSLSGGAGLDSFVFNTALGAASNVDRINGFVAADDTIRLENAVFKALVTTGTLAAGAFVLGTAAQDAGDRIVYDRGTGKLWYDSDGSGGAAQVLFASVAAATSLTHEDFVIV